MAFSGSSDPGDRHNRVNSDKWALVKTLAQSYALDILEALDKKPQRFSDLAKQGPNERTRSLRLKELEEAGLITTISQKVDKKRYFVHYKLTPKGKLVFDKIKEVAENQ